MQIAGSVEYQDEALRAILDATHGPIGTVKLPGADAALRRRGKYQDRGLDITVGTDRSGREALHVNYTGSGESAKNLERYFADVGRFGGSHLAMTAANGRRRKTHIDW